MKIQHPRAARGERPPSTVSVSRYVRANVDEDGYFEVRDDRAVAVMQALSTRYGVEYDDEGEVVDEAAASDEEPASSEATADEADTDTETEDADPAAAVEGTLEDLEDALASGDYDDVLDEVEAAEEAGEDRSGAYDRIDDRRDELPQED